MIDYLTRDAFEVNLTNCADAMKEDFKLKTNETLKPWKNKLFHVSTNSSRLEKEKSNVFHRFTMKHVFLLKRVQPEVESGVGFLSAWTSISM